MLDSSMAVTHEKHRSTISDSSSTILFFGACVVSLTHRRPRCFFTLPASVCGVVPTASTSSRDVPLVLAAAAYQSTASVSMASAAPGAVKGASADGAACASGNAAPGGCTGRGWSNLLRCPASSECLCRRRTEACVGGSGAEGATDALFFFTGAAPRSNAPSWLATGCSGALAARDAAGMRRRTRAATRATSCAARAR